VDPGSGYAFVLDHQYRMQQREVDLIAGPHHFTFWAPERRMIDTTINVVEGRTREITILLPYSDEYRNYERDLRDLKKQTLLNVGASNAPYRGGWSTRWYQLSEVQDGARSAGG
jgi:hypothetical protein